MTAASPILIACAPLGARRQRAEHPRLPATLEETVACARQLLDLGCGLLHLHVRDDRGRHTLDADIYREWQAAIRKAVGRHLILQVTSEAAGVYSAPEQMAIIDALAPEAVSCALREMCPDERHELSATAFYQRQRARGVMVQHILYDTEDALRFSRLQQDGVMGPGPHHVLFVIGRRDADAGRDLEPLIRLLSHRPSGTWMVCGFDRLEHPATAAAALLGGHVRLGFENNLNLADGGLAPDNAALVTQLAPWLALAGRRPMTAAEARALWFAGD